MTRRLGLHGSVRPPRPLGHALRQLARWAIAGSLGAATGCGDSAEPDDGAALVGCEDIRNVLREASFSRDHDYFSIWRDFNIPFMRGTGGGIYVNKLGESGVPCESAEDTAACMEALEAATMVRENCRDAANCGAFAVVTKGESVTLIDMREQLLSWLAPIDSLSDALALSSWDNKVLECSSTNLVRDGDRFLFSTVRDDCGKQQLLRDHWEVSESGTTTQTDTEKVADTNCAVGRRPEGLCPFERRIAMGTLAAHFAEIAHLEAASVYAFERLARELTRFGAPASLVGRAASSALDEIHHAQLMGATARRFGAEPYLVRLFNLPARGLYQLALENAVEGCVHETFGVVIAHHQAARAQDPQLRAAMRVIARDESRHAELAWQVAAWVRPQLSAAQRSELDQAEALAWLALERAQSQHVMPPSAARAIGLPEPAIARALVRHMKSNLHDREDDRRGLRGSVEDPLALGHAGRGC